jgi:glutamate-5-semialdehyde dehydrogenase
VLDNAKLESLVRGIDDLLIQPDPLGVQTLARELAPGLVLRRVTCPLGVLAIIFEARPEAVVQIATLAIKSGNAVILKGGKEAARSNAALVEAVRAAIAEVAAAAPAGASTVPVDAVQFVSTREEVADLLKQDA